MYLGSNGSAAAQFDGTAGLTMLNSYPINATAAGGITGSITRTTAGTPFITVPAGNIITVTTGSNGQVMLSGTPAAGVCTLEQFGAVGDGVTSDQAAFEAARAAEDGNLDSFLDADSGRVEWLRSYLEEADRPGGRPLPSAPVIAGGVIYVLAQDATAPLAFDRWSGRALPWPEMDVPWEDVDALVGRSGEWLVFAGKRNFAVRPSDGKVASLGEEEAPGAGRAALGGGRLYLPSRAGLRVFDAASWTPLATHAWAAGIQGGNVAVDAGMVAVLGDKLDLCTSAGLLAGEEAEPLLRRARAFENGGRAKEAIDTFQRGLKLLEKDPAAAARAEEVRARIEKLREAPPAVEEKK